MVLIDLTNHFCSIRKSDSGIGCCSVEADRLGDRSNHSVLHRPCARHARQLDTQCACSRESLDAPAMSRR